MNRENDILKWFNGEITTEALKNRYPNEDFSTLEKSQFYSKQFELPQIDAQKALEDFKTRKLKKKTTKVVPLNFKSFLKIAAILIVMLGSSYVLFFNNPTSYSTKIAQIERFNLPDNSEVILNSKSQLSFNRKDWKKNRTLDLQGEAFFKVTKGEKFTVQTGVGTVQVLGTQFNVKERQDYFEVKCYEGSVSVTYASEKTILTPGKTLRIVKGEQVIVKEFNYKNPAWLVQESSFDNVPLWQVIDELEIHYDITISTKAINTSILFSGTFTHTDKNIALKSVTIPLKLSYIIDGNNVEFYNYDSH
ncbi:FecR family protein [Winogradskyella psychrotolerans]|uniref:FecR family protein n=1 Tax=Winogradskyella psychrotolerans TaxID=1344585 RepID=UPI001C075ED3|nr:FecR family protein [Winogradskyella psychrotolerans]MBU2930218.1 FecR family protein [Winogradskyella psychrotolerans]